MLTVHDANGFLIGNFSDYFALVDYFLLTALKSDNFNLVLNDETISVNEQLYTIEYHELQNKRSDLDG